MLIFISGVSQFFQGAFTLALLALVLKQMVELMLGGGSIAIPVTNGKL
jgi:hypothetical protein